MQVCPSDWLWTDLGTEISEWEANDKQIILIGGCNSEASEVEILMSDHYLLNSICELYGYNEAPITYQRSKDCPIDGIYCSASVIAHYRGYPAFGKIVGDHRVLWINITQAALIRFHQHKIILPLARHIRLDEPLTVRRYNTFLHHSFLNYNVYNRITATHTLAVYPPPYHHARSLERLDTLIVELMHKADKMQKKKRQGKIVHIV